MWVYAARWPKVRAMTMQEGLDNKAGVPELTHSIFDDCPGGHAQHLTRVAVSGSRCGLRGVQLLAFPRLMADLPRTCTIIHGGARGVDTMAPIYAEKHGMR